MRIRRTDILLSYGLHVLLYNDMQIQKNNCFIIHSTVRWRSDFAWLLEVSVREFYRMAAPPAHTV